MIILDDMEGAYYHTKKSVDEYIKMAEGINGSELIEKLKDFLPENSTVLEIGSGPGSDWEILDTYYRVTGSDNSTEFVNRLLSKYPNGQFLKLNAVTLGTDQKFNGIYSNKVLHHLTDDELHTSINRQYELLEVDGIICHSFWKGEGSEVFKGMFVNNHTEKELPTLFGDKFEIQLMESYLEFEEGDSILLIARKNKIAK